MKRRPRYIKRYRGWLYASAAKYYRAKNPHASPDRIVVWEPWRGAYRFVCYTNIRDMVRMINRELRMRPLRKQETPL